MYLYNLPHRPWTDRTKFFGGFAFKLLLEKGFMAEKIGNRRFERYKLNDSAISKAYIKTMCKW